MDQSEQEIEEVIYHYEFNFQTCRNRKRFNEDRCFEIQARNRHFNHKLYHTDGYMLHYKLDSEKIIVRTNHREDRWQALRWAEAIHWSRLLRATKLTDAHLWRAEHSTVITARARKNQSSPLRKHQRLHELTETSPGKGIPEPHVWAAEKDS